MVVNWATSAPRAIRCQPQGLVIENYLAAPARCDRTTQAAYKSVVDPSGVLRCLLEPHSFVHRDGQPVNEERRPVDTLKRIDRISRSPGRGCGSTTTGSRSEEERRRKARAVARTVGSMRGAAERAGRPSRAIRSGTRRWRRMRPPCARRSRAASRG